LYNVFLKKENMNFLWKPIMDYRFTAILIILLCLLAVFVKPAYTPLKVDSKDYILPKPKPKINEK